MYLNRKGHVTAGKCTLLPDATSAAALAFKDWLTGNPTSVDEIRAEFERIAGKIANIGRNAACFRQFTDFILVQSEIDRLVKDHMPRRFRGHAADVPNLRELPLVRADCPVGHDWGDWQEAANQSHRLDISDERNTYMFVIFMDAAADP